jgi:signal recognition particle receptor subunit alpha
MIEFFAIFSKGGLLLWYFSEGKDLFKGTINEFIANVLLLERTVSSYNHDGMTVKYKLDNELDLVVLVIYQSIIQLSYADRLLSEAQLRFRDMYKNTIEEGRFFSSGSKSFKNFDGEFQKILTEVKIESNASKEPTKPRNFEKSLKSQKTVKSMVETAADRQAKAAEKAKADQKAAAEKSASPPNSPSQGEDDEDVLKNLEKLKNRGKKPVVAKKEEPKKQQGKKGKENRKWELGGNASDAVVLDYSSGSPSDPKSDGETAEEKQFLEQNRHLVGKHGGELAGLDENFVEEEEKEIEENHSVQQSKGWFSAFKSLVGNKQLTADDIEPVMEKMKETLTGKNVASEPATKICESVAAKLDGKVISSFSRITTIVREAMRDSLVQLLTPKRRVDILRDIKQAKHEKRPYVIVFCGVNGVGKSTNLAKITFWLNENKNRVLIAAGDTFRAGAVEQLRTHTRHLNALHPNSVQLFEQGYGKDPAGLAAAAIEIAKERQVDVVLVDTAGRMQDNEPLMRSLSKLIRTNNPDLVLFVGEALVGNEAVDQLVKFNEALADHSDRDAIPRLIDGIVLTKFDTIDDKVGAAVSMTYITGQPIVFVGTGQTYADLKSLNVNAVVNSLLK